MQVSQVDMGVFLHVLYLITVTGSRISLLNSELISSAKLDVQFAVTTLSPPPVSLPCSRIYMSAGNSNSCPYNRASSTLSLTHLPSQEHQYFTLEGKASEMVQWVNKNINILN